MVAREPRECAACGLPRSQHLRVSEGSPLTPQPPPNTVGAILLLRARPYRPQPRGGSGNSLWDTLQIQPQRGLLPLFPTGPNKTAEPWIQASCFRSHPESKKACFKKAKIFVWGSILCVSWIFCGVLRLKNKPHSRQTYALSWSNSIFHTLRG